MSQTILCVFPVRYITQLVQLVETVFFFLRSYLCVYVPACMSVQRMSAVPMEASRGHYIAFNYSVGWL